MANKILTVSELAEHLNVHRITIYRLLKSGSLPGFKIGRVWRFDLDEIGLWMADGKSTQAMSAATDGDGDGHLDGHGDAKTDGHLDGHGDAMQAASKRSPYRRRKPSAAWSGKGTQAETLISNSPPLLDSRSPKNDPRYSRDCANMVAQRESGGTADAPDLGSGAARRGGSSPPSRTIADFSSGKIFREGFFEGEQLDGAIKFAYPGWMEMDFSLGDSFLRSSLCRMSARSRICRISSTFHKFKLAASGS